MKKTATIVGMLFITAIVAGVLCVVVSGTITDDPDYLIKVTENENQVVIGVLLQLMMAFACAGIAVWLYPVLKKHNAALALGSVCFRTIEAVLFIVSATGSLILLALSQEYVKAGAPDAAYFQTLGALITAGGDWFATGPGAIAFCLGALMYYYVFYQSQLIPRWLSGWGGVAIAAHLASALLVMFGNDPFSTITLLLNVPIFFNELVLAIWLIIKGFSPAANAAGAA